VSALLTGSYKLRQTALHSLIQHRLGRLTTHVCGTHPKAFWRQAAVQARIGPRLSDGNQVPESRRVTQIATRVVALCDSCAAFVYAASAMSRPGCPPRGRTIEGCRVFVEVSLRLFVALDLRLKLNPAPWLDCHDQEKKSPRSLLAKWAAPLALNKHAFGPAVRGLPHRS